jgi:hypothetical protein
VNVVGEKCELHVTPVRSFTCGPTIIVTVPPPGKSQKRIGLHVSPD